MHYILLLFCQSMTTMMFFGVLQLQSLLVCWKECIISLPRGFHHPVLSDCLLLWLNFSVIIQQFRFSDLYITILLHTCQIFSITPKIQQVIVDIMSIVSLCQEFLLRNFGKRSFYYCGTVLWNSFPLRAVEAARLSAFKYLHFNS